MEKIPFHPKFNPELLEGKDLDDLTLGDIKNSIENQDFIRLKAPKGFEHISQKWSVIGVTNNRMLNISPVENPHNHTIPNLSITLDLLKDLMIKIEHELEPALEIERQAVIESIKKLGAEDDISGEFIERWMANCEKWIEEDPTNIIQVARRMAIFKFSKYDLYVAAGSRYEDKVTECLQEAIQKAQEGEDLDLIKIIESVLIKIIETERKKIESAESLRIGNETISKITDDPKFKELQERGLKEFGITKNYIFIMLESKYGENPSYINFKKEIEDLGKKYGMYLSMRKLFV